MISMTNGITYTWLRYFMIFLCLNYVFILIEILLKKRCIVHEWYWSGDYSTWATAFISGKNWMVVGGAYIRLFVYIEWIFRWWFQIFFWNVHQKSTLEGLLAMSPLLGEDSRGSPSWLKQHQPAAFQLTKQKSQDVFLCKPKIQGAKHLFRRVAAKYSNLWALEDVFQHRIESISRNIPT